MMNVPAISKCHLEIAQLPNVRSVVVAGLLMCLLQPLGCSPQASGDGAQGRVAMARHRSTPDAASIAPTEAAPAPSSIPTQPEGAAPLPPALPQRQAHDAAVRDAAATELGNEVAATMPSVPPTPPPQPPDPGAVAIVDSMNRTLLDREASPEGVTLISVRELRNLSHASDTEFIRMRARLCAILTRAGAASKLVFVDAENPAIATHYRLLGSAYLVTADGFDQWEMYLSLTPAARNFQVWDARSAVRMLRLPRPGQQEITFTPR